MVSFLLCGHYIFGDALKRLWVELGEGGEDLAVEEDLLLQGSTDELRVGEARPHSAERGVDLDRPHAAEIIFLVLAVCELICASFAECDFGFDLFLGATVAETLRVFQDSAAAFV